MKIAITGANSSVGKNLLSHLSTESDIQIVAGVRSESAFSTLPEAPGINPRVISYDDTEDLTAAFEGVDAVVHLAGILMESRHSTYEKLSLKIEIKLQGV